MVSAYVDNFQWPPFFQVYVKAVGDTGVNVGAFVLGIVKKPEITLSGRTVQGTLGFNTMDEMMLNLAECIGTEIAYTKVDMDSYVPWLGKRIEPDIAIFGNDWGTWLDAFGERQLLDYSQGHWLGCRY
ncbi:hypothetical protein EYZ11_007226 [Aspergillus tanneri]|uniref:Uncharacterized protein n=1 Tax=Aspergillus tanneri TaxID=1220188 RepID=A0A4S3JJ60_9EURO|nr:hypothetical protein EYZ11_007226 [Aspergillus tanneri]